MPCLAVMMRHQRSLTASAAAIVFGMEDGSMSIVGLLFGVEATTMNAATVLVFGSAAAVAPASMPIGMLRDHSCNAG